MNNKFKRVKIKIKKMNYLKQGKQKFNNKIKKSRKNLKRLLKILKMIFSIILIRLKKN